MNLHEWIIAGKRAGQPEFPVAPFMLHPASKIKFVGCVGLRRLSGKPEVSIRRRRFPDKISAILPVHPTALFHNRKRSW